MPPGSAHYSDRSPGTRAVRTTRPSFTYDKLAMERGLTTTGFVHHHGGDRRPHPMGDHEADQKRESPSLLIEATELTRARLDLRRAPPAGGLAGCLSERASPTRPAHNSARRGTCWPPLRAHAVREWARPSRPSPPQQVPGGASSTPPQSQSVPPSRRVWIRRAL